MNARYDLKDQRQALLDDIVLSKNGQSRSVKRVPLFTDTIHFNSLKRDKTICPKKD
jgi:hypothetical protein